MMITEFEAVPPAFDKSKVHPTIYFVQLPRAAGLAWEVSLAYRQAHLEKFRERARAAGKKRIEVWGRYCKLGDYEV
jgi:hypothetical protein